MTRDEARVRVVVFEPQVLVDSLGVVYSAAARAADLCTIVGRWHVKSLDDPTEPEKRRAVVEQIVDELVARSDPVEAHRRATMLPSAW